MDGDRHAHKELLHSKRTFLQLSAVFSVSTNRRLVGLHAPRLSADICMWPIRILFVHSPHLHTECVTLGSAAHEYSPHSRAASEEVCSKCDKRGGYGGQTVMTAVDSRTKWVSLVLLHFCRNDRVYSTAKSCSACACDRRAPVFDVSDSKIFGVDFMSSEL